MIKAARTQLQDLLDQAVMAGRIPPAQADSVLANLDQTALQIANHTTFGQQWGRCFGRMKIRTTPVPSTHTNDA